jgi:hypothetical protein
VLDRQERAGKVVKLTMDVEVGTLDKPFLMYRAGQYLIMWLRRLVAGDSVPVFARFTVVSWSLGQIDLDWDGLQANNMSSSLKLRI